VKLAYHDVSPSPKMRPALKRAAKELRRVDQPCQCHICTLVRIEDRLS
jgi:hypothetical protein